MGGCDQFRWSAFAFISLRAYSNLRTFFYISNQPFFGFAFMRTIRPLCFKFVNSLSRNISFHSPYFLELPFEKSQRSTTVSFSFSFHSPCSVLWLNRSDAQVAIFSRKGSYICIDVWMYVLVFIHFICAVNGLLSSLIHGDRHVACVHPPGSCTVSHSMPW